MLKRFRPGKVETEPRASRPIEARFDWRRRSISTIDRKACFRRRGCAARIAKPSNMSGTGRSFIAGFGGFSRFASEASRIPERGAAYLSGLSNFFRGPLAGGLAIDQNHLSRRRMVSPRTPSELKHDVGSQTRFYGLIDLFSALRYQDVDGSCIRAVRCAWFSDDFWAFSPSAVPSSG